MQQNLDQQPAYFHKKQTLQIFFKSDFFKYSRHLLLSVKVKYILNTVTLLVNGNESISNVTELSMWKIKLLLESPHSSLSTYQLCY